MPRAGQFDTTYPDKLKEIGIELLEEFKGSKKHHHMKCMTCDHEWVATPTSKLNRSFKIFGVSGCPECKRNRLFFEKQQHCIQLIKDKGFEILSHYDGKQTTTKKIRVKRIQCKHEFDVAPGNIIHRNVQCPTCATQYRTNILNHYVELKHDYWVQTATSWQVYKSTVTSLSRKNYIDYKNTINPNNFPRGKAGVKGAYHLDHIVPIRWCFDNHVPAEICAHQSNLQMITWRSNVGSRDRIKENTIIPQILQEYVL